MLRNSVIRRPDGGERLIRPTDPETWWDLVAGDNLHRQTAARCFTVFGVHVFTGFVHGLDDFIKAHARFAGTAQRHTCGVHCFNRSNGVTLNARYLYRRQPDRRSDPGYVPYRFPPRCTPALGYRPAVQPDRPQPWSRQRRLHPDSPLRRQR